MKITVHYSTKTGTVKQAFNKIFPYLKIEFIKTDSSEQKMENKFSVNILHNRFLGEINNNIRQAEINIRQDDKANYLEELFYHQFGLPIKVFKKERKHWLPAAIEDLTLSQQNEQAMMKARSFNS
jgi:hypothetical protein